MGCTNLFPTPVFTHDLLGWGEKNEALHRHALTLREKDPTGVLKSNIGGWHSSDRIDLSGTPELREFQQVLLDAVRIVVDGMGYQGISIGLTGAWFTLSPAGASNMRHCHPRAFLSGVYYVKAPVGSSPLLCHDPRTVKTFSAPPSTGSKLTPYTADSAVFPVEESRLIIFPGWLEHSVAANQSTGDRVVLSFNFGLPP